MSKVAVLGPHGTFTEIAAKDMFPKAELEYMDDVGDVFKYVDEGNGEGVAAIENSLEGSVGLTLESLMKYDLKISGEVTLDINLCLMAKPKVKGKDIKVVRSHPHALAQCKGYLTANYPEAKRQTSSSTAEAMREAAERDDTAAVGYKDAGRRYGLDVIAEGIQDEESQTRFISLSKNETTGPKTSIIFATKDEPGALYSILKTFADNTINLTRIESRPSRRRLGEYVFYLDYENKNMSSGEKEKLHNNIRERITYFKDLGSY